ncbi:MAG: Uma2 family endonuclease [Acidobacteria bacterium]|nr:Uma2 family endonuclease [Acidobacteriota bacterium]
MAHTADLAIFADRKPADGVIPFGAVEILSPDDSLSTYIGKFDEYAAAGIEFIWLVDPAHGRIQRHQNGSLLRVDAIEFPDRGFRLTADEIFA